MAPTKPVILLIGGGWHVPESYKKLTDSLEQVGYTVIVPRLPSVNDARPPIGDLETDTEAIHTVTEDLCNKGNKIVALMHSYGGQLGTNSLGIFNIKTRTQQGLPGGITQLIYMCASALPEGTTQVDKVTEMGHTHQMPIAFDVSSDDMSALCRDPKLIMVGESPSGKISATIPDSEIKNYLTTFVRWNAKCMYQPITNHPAWKEDIPVCYIYTTLDMTLPFEYQKSMVEVMRLLTGKKTVDTCEIETGHCPNFTATEKVVDAVQKFITNA